MSKIKQVEENKMKQKTKQTANNKEEVESKISKDIKRVLSGLEDKYEVAYSFVISTDDGFFAHACIQPTKKTNNFLSSVIFREFERFGWDVVGVSPNSKDGRVSVLFVLSVDVRGGAD